MAAFADAPGKLVNVQIELEDGLLEQLCMLEQEMRDFPKQALEAIQGTARRLLHDRPLLRLIYLDDEGDACTLTSCAIEDALSFATTDGMTSTLKITVLTSQPAAVPPAMPATVPATEPEVNPPTAPAEVLPAADNEAPVLVPIDAFLPLEASGPEEPVAAPAEPALEQAPEAAVVEAAVEAAAAASGKRSLEVHERVACDNCGQTPILGKRFKCLECQDYDLCERCHKRTELDGSVHPHVNWVQMHSLTHVEVRGDVESAEIVEAYYSPPQSQPAHVRVACDMCDMCPIVGTRYRCTTVPDFDLCSGCYAKRAEVLFPNWDQPFEELYACAASSEPCSSPPLELPPLPPKPEAPVEAYDELCGLPALSASQGAAAFKALAASMSDELCLVALEALLQHPDARLRFAAAAAAAEAFDKAASTDIADQPGSSSGEPQPVVEEQEAVAPTEEAAAPAEEVAAPTEEEVKEVAAPAEEALTEEVVAPTEEVVAPAEEVVAPTEEVPQTPSQPSATPSAAIVSSSQLVLGVEAAEDEAARGDISQEFAEIAAQLNMAGSQAYRCGRVVLPACNSGVQVPVEAKMIIVNNGPVAWPEASCISIVHGDPFGLPMLNLGAMEPGQAAEIIFDLNVPLQETAAMTRSIWSMMDASTGAPFGPLIFFEAVWVKI